MAEKVSGKDKGIAMNQKRKYLTVNIGLLEEYCAQWEKIAQTEYDAAKSCDKRLTSVPGGVPNPIQSMEHGMIAYGFKFCANDIRNLIKEAKR